MKTIFQKLTLKFLKVKHQYTFNIYMCLLIITAMSSCKTGISQNTVNNWDHNQNTELVVWPGEIIVVGTISDDGIPEFQLNDPVFNKLKEATIKQQADFYGSHEGLKVPPNTLENEFSICKDSIPYNNPESEVFKMAEMGTFGVWDAKAEKPLGQLRIVSSLAFNDTYFSGDPSHLSTGYFINFLYAEDEAFINGACHSVDFLDQENNVSPSTITFDINLKPGWNIIKTEVKETIKDQTGNIYPLETMYSTIDKIPEDAKYLFTPR